MQQDLSRLQQQKHRRLYGLQALWTIVVIILMAIWVTVANSPEAAAANPYSSLPLPLLMVMGFYFIVRLALEESASIPRATYFRVATDGTMVGLALTIPALVLHDMVLLNMPVLSWPIDSVLFFGAPLIMMFYFFRSAYNNAKEVLIPDGVFYTKEAVKADAVITIGVQALLIVIAAVWLEHVVF